MRKIASLGGMLVLGGTMVTGVTLVLPDKLMTGWLWLFCAGYIGTLALGWYGHKLSGWYRVLAGPLAWVYFLAYTVVTIHVAQTYYHPGGH